MDKQTVENITEAFHAFIRNDHFPCVGAKGALAKDNIRIMVAEKFGNRVQDREILEFIYKFIKDYRKARRGLHSAVVIFKEPENIDEETFEKMFWKCLQSLRDMDATKFGYDKRVSSDPFSPSYSFSLMEEAFLLLHFIHAAAAKPGDFLTLLSCLIHILNLKKCEKEAFLQK